jgi:hypothetical protein
MDCMILGSGPSLKYALLPDLPSFGCNFIGLLPYQPTYYVCVDLLTLAHPDIITPFARSAKIAFLRDFSSCDPKPRPLYELPNVFLIKRKTFTLKWERAVTGGTAVYMMLKIAYWMGFDTVYLYGVDHTTGHFSPDYPQGKKNEFEYWEYHYRLAAEEYKRAGKRIINMSPPSVLNSIFA